MATVTMTNGHRYKFAASAGAPVLVESSDNVGDVNYFHNAVHMEDIEADQGSLGFLTVKGDNGNTSYGPQILCWNIGSGDAGISFRCDSQYWTIGQDNSDGNSFGIYESYVMGSLRAIGIDTSRNVTIDNDLYVNDYARIDALRVGTTSTDPGDGNLYVENDITLKAGGDILFEAGNGQISWTHAGSGGNHDYLKMAQGNEDRAYIKLFDYGNEHSQRAYFFYDTDTNFIGIQQHRDDSGTSHWPVFYVNQYGTVYATGTYNQTSDERLKEEVKTIESSLDTIKKLRGVSFTWNDKSSTPGVKSFGMIAQETETVIPELVNTETKLATKNDSPDNTPTSNIDNAKSISYANLAGHFVEAIKEQQVIIEDLKARIIALEAK